VKITLLSDERIRLDGNAGPLTVEAESPDAHYSPFHMLASGLATCTYAVLRSWAENAGLEGGDLAVEVGWSFADDPHRVGAMEVDLLWPSLPSARHAAAVRTADLCAIKKTLVHPPEVRTEVKT
jgi:uncharacterized OsmC-like protein